MEASVTATPLMPNMRPGPQNGRGGAGTVPVEAIAAYARATDAPTFVVTSDAQDTSPAAARLSWLNGAAADLLAIDASSLVGRSLGEVHGLAFDDGESLRSTRTTTVTLGVSAPGRDQRRIRGRAVPAGPRTWVIVAGDDESLKAAADLASSESRFRALIEKMPVATGFSDVGLRLGYVNDRMSELFEAPASWLTGTGWLDLVDPEDRPAFDADLVDVLHGRPVERVIGLAVPSGLRRVHARVTPVSMDRQSVRFVAAFDDVTEATRVAHQLTWQATHDQLTGLPNRTSLWDRLRQETESGRRMAVAFVDLDNFKYVNDTLGHRAGDQLLVEVARRLRAGCRDTDRIFRLAGDEFVVVAPGVSDYEAAAALAARLTATLFTAAHVDGGRVEVSGSVGVVVSDADDDAETLLRNADVAMYQAKDAGGNRYALFDETVQHRLSQRMRLAADLRAALAAPEGSGLAMVFQPIVQANDRGLVGAEALLRWSHPELGAIPPPEVIEVAESHRLGDQLGCWVLEQSLAGLDALRTLAGPSGGPAYVAVNATAAQVASRSFVSALEGHLEAGRDPVDVCVELTETALMTAPAVLENLATIRERGVRVSIDDFGTGYSSLAYLSRLPVTTIKVDRSFVVDLAESEVEATSRSLVAVLVSLAEAVGMDLVAEGVEDEQTAQRIAALGCDFAQGYHYGRPMSVVDFAAWMEGRR